MKKSRLKFISAIVAVLGFALIAMACSPKETKTKAYDYLVTFNYNVGEIKDQYVGAMNGTTLKNVKPGYNDTIQLAAVEGYYFEDWYLPKLDENGEPIVGEDKRVVLDRKWDFYSDKVKSDITLYANFVPNPKLIIEGGDNKRIFDRNPDTEFYVDNDNKKAGYTFVGYYEDAGYQNKIIFDDRHPYKFGYEDKTVYAKFIEGDWFGRVVNGEWKSVESVEDFNKAMLQKKSIKLENDLDFTGKKWLSYDLNAEIDGNNKKITGITVDWIWAKVNGINYSLFPNIGAKANIHDLTIENVNASFKKGASNPNTKVALFANNIAEGAKLSKINVSGTLTIVDITDAQDKLFLDIDDTYNDNNAGEGMASDCVFNVSLVGYGD